MSIILCHYWTNQDEHESGSFTADDVKALCGERVSLTDSDASAATSDVNCQKCLDHPHLGVYQIKETEI